MFCPFPSTEPYDDQGIHPPMEFQTYTSEDLSEDLIGATDLLPGFRSSVAKLFVVE